MRIFMKSIVAILIFVLCSCGENIVVNMKINVGEKMGDFENISVQTISSNIEYIPLETSDSSLIGAMPNICVLNDAILVSSANQCLKLFDRPTGRFIRDIGHVGVDPEGYAKDSWGIVNYWVDYTHNLIYVLGWNNDLVIFDLLGNCKDRLQIYDDTRYNLSQSYLFIDSGRIWGHNKLYISNLCSSLFFVEQNTKSINDIIGLSILPLPMDEIQSISNLLGNYVSYGGNLTMASFTDDRKFYTSIDSPSLWKNGDKICLKQAFNDTIYTLCDDRIYPYLIFELGDWKWNYKDRLEVPGCERKISIDYVLENEKYIYFHFHTGLYLNNRQSYCGLYQKESNRVTLMRGDRIFDVINNQDIQLRTITSDGCFVALLQPNELCDELKDKYNCKEDDNPIIVILRK